MKLSRENLLFLRRPLLVFVLSVIVSCGIIYEISVRKNHAQQEFNLAQMAANRAREALQNRLTDQADLQIYADRFSALTQRGILGDEHRLDWLESLNELRKRQLVLDLRYSIAAQTPYTPTSPIDTGNFELRYSAMKLQFDLLHEAQLLNFFAALRAQNSGWYQLENCTLKRGNADAEIQLQAECTGGWITLKKREGVL